MNTNNTNGNGWYGVSAEETRIHLCSNYYLAQMVKQNLYERLFQNIAMAKVKFEREFYWDTGVYGSSPNKSINLPENIIFRWDSRYRKELRDVISYNFSQAKSKYEERFYKLHGTISPHVLCLTPEQANVLYKCVVEGYEQRIYNMKTVESFKNGF